MTPFYEDHKITIYHASCLDVMCDMKDKSINLIVTDPPYGINLEYDIYVDTEDSWFKLMDKAIPEMRRIAKMVIMPSCKIKILHWIYTNHAPDWLISWHKGSPGHNSAIGFNDWEPLLVYGRNDGICMHDHFSISNNEKMGNYGHPCPKPLGWATWLISNATNKGDLVFDPFMGSGTTLRAAKSLGLKAIGCDISKRYCEIAAKRMAEDTFASIDYFDNLSIDDYVRPAPPKRQPQTLFDFLSEEHH